VPWLFHRDGKPIKSFRSAWQSACKAAGVPGRIPHDFRRTAVRNLERAGVPRSDGMEMVGHETESIYDRYAISDGTSKKESAAKYAAFQERLSANVQSNLSRASHDRLRTGKGDG
jgi:integrase